MTFTPYWHYHPEIELCYIINGSGTRFVGDSIAPFSNGDLILIGENIPHHWVSNTQGNIKSQSALVFQFDRKLFNSFTECRHFQTLISEAKRGVQFLNPKEEFIQSLKAFESLSPIKRLSQFIQLLDLLVNHEERFHLCSENYSERQSYLKHRQKFARTNDYIISNLNTKLTVEHMSAFTNMTDQAFCRWFKKQSGYTFINFLNQIRIENACQLLISTQLSIRDIAFQSGFESISHFNRTFKKYRNQSPRSLRKNF